MEDKRQSPRQRVLKSGKIEFVGSGGQIACAVRNISKTGAAVDIGGYVIIPRSLTLTLEADRLARLCKVIWRKENRIGVAFQ